MSLPKDAMLTRLNARLAEGLDALLELGLPSVEVLGLAIALERSSERMEHPAPKQAQAGGAAEKPVVDRARPTERLDGREKAPPPH